MWGENQWREKSLRAVVCTLALGADVYNIYGTKGMLFSIDIRRELKLRVETRSKPFVVNGGLI